MAILDLLRRNPPTAAESAGQAGQTLGRTPPAPDPGTVRPRAGLAPLGQSGRANFYGHPQTDELNPKLVGPAGLRLLDEMYRTDPHVRRLVLAAWSPVPAGTWSLEPYGGEDATDADRQIADTIWWALTHYMSPTLTQHLASLGPLLLRSGFTAYEQLWSPVRHDGRTLLLPRKLDVRLPRSVWRWWQDDFGELTHIAQTLPSGGGEPIPASELVYYRIGEEGDNWQGTSLLRHSYKSWMLKDRLERIQAIGEERKAVGLPVVYPPEGADDATRTAVERIFAAVHVSDAAFILMPGPKAGLSDTLENEGWSVDVIKFDSSSGASIKDAITYHQTSIASSFLTDFLELGHHQVGARATAQVQEDPFLTAINGALLPVVMPPLDALVDRIRKLNWDGSEGSPQLKVTLHDEASLSEIADYVAACVKSGAMQVDPELEDWLRSRAGLPPANRDVRAQRQAMRDAAVAASQAAADEPPNPDEPTKPGGPPPKHPTGGGSAPPNGGPEPTRVVPAAKKTLDQDGAPTGAMVALYPPAADAEQLALPGGEAPDDLHVTLAFLGPADQLAHPDAIHAAAARFAASEQPIDATVAGFGVFTDSDTPVTYHAIDAPTLAPARRRLVDHLHAAAIPVSADHGFNPHMTLAYSDRRKDAAPPDGKLLRFDRVSSVVGADRRDHPLAGARPRPKQLDGAAAPSAKWWEQLLSQGRLRDAFDGARQSIEQAAHPQALTAARKLAHHAANGHPLTDDTPPPELIDAIAAEYERLYQLGRDTVATELAAQRGALGKQLDAKDVFAAVGDRLARARRRGEHSARNVVHAVSQRLRRDQVTALKDPAALQQAAEQAATGQLHVEALANASVSVNDGRTDAALSDGSVIGGYYTSVMDASSCDPCILADTGELLSVDEATLRGPPNPACDGQDKCRCAIVWVLSDDPAALAAVVSQGA